MRVEEVMTRDVAVVSPGMSLRDVARLLSERSISGAPVCDGTGRVVGVVSEADVLAKEEGLALDEGSPLAWLAGNGRDRRKAAARTAGEAMTAPPITIEPRASVAEAARSMIERGVNRLPVVEHGRLVGIVTRADLVRAFTRSDSEIRREIEQDVLLRTLWIPPADVSIEVDDGAVTLRGTLDSKTTADLVAAYVRRVPGVVDVHADELDWRFDDQDRRVGKARLPIRMPRKEQS
jgi:CBS domain-containing protein